MKTRRSIAVALFALGLCTLPALASAQPFHPQHPQAPQRGHDLVGATHALSQQATAEAPRGRFAGVAQRLALEARTMHQSGNTARFEPLYVRARRMVATPEQNAMPSDALLDAWDAVVVAYRPMRFAGPRPLPRPEPRPLPMPPVAYQFEGRFEQIPVQLQGRTLAELEGACLQFTSAIDTRHVDDVTIGARAIRNGPSYWDAPALCSIVVLNATSRGPRVTGVEGSIEGLPFAVSGASRVEVEQTLRRHLPRLVRGMQVDDITINGRPYRNGPSYWSAEQIVALIVSQLPAGTIAYQPQPRW